jgi:hypothetical protein
MMIDLLGQACGISGRTKRCAVGRRRGGARRARKAQPQGQQHRKNNRTHSHFLSVLDLELKVSKAGHLIPIGPSVLLPSTQSPTSVPTSRGTGPYRIGSLATTLP